MRFLRVLALAVILSGVGSFALLHGQPFSRASAAGSGWTSYHLDGTHSGFDANEPAWTAAAPLAQWTSPTLDGQIYGEPLAYGGRLFVTTTSNSIYALDETTGAVVWRSNLGANANGGWQCGNINPQGITGTPVIDPVAGVIYAVGTSPDLHYQFYAVNLVDGSPAAAPRDITPAGMDVAIQGQRAALTLANGQVYVPFGGRIGDCGNYHPFLVAVPVNGAPFKTFQPQSAGQREAGMWGPSGGATDGAAVYLATGNGGETNCAGTWDYGNGVLKLDANLGLTDFWAPNDWCSLSASDTDIGSLGPALLQNGVLFQAGKAGVGYLISASSLGHFGGELFSGQVCPGGVFGGTAYAPPMVFVPCSGGGIAGVKVTGNSFSVAWQSGPSNPGPPIVAGGLVWTETTGGGSLYGLDPFTGAQRYHLSLSGGSSNHFNTPTADSGWIFTAQASLLHGFKFASSTPTPTPTPLPTYTPQPAAPFTAVTPTRVLDTRSSQHLGAQQTVDVQVTGGQIPASATSAVINVTVTGPTAPSYLSIFPAGTQRPTASNLNFTAGQTIPNLAQVPLGAGGKVSVYNFSGVTDVVMDVEGYVDARSQLKFTPQVPSRLVDTRGSAPLDSGGVLTIPMPAGASAVVLNVTVTGTTAGSYLSVYPSQGSPPAASNLNWTAGQTVANRVIVGAGQGGQVSFYNYFGRADVVVDLGGVFSTATGGQFTGLSPARILDTRTGLGGSGALGARRTIDVQVAGAGGVPAGATAVVLNLTATNPDSSSYVTAFPTGSTLPVASDLNFVPGQTVPNLVVVQLGTGGKLSLYNLAGNVDLIADVAGYYV